MLHPFDVEFEKPDYSEKSRSNDHSSATDKRQNQNPFYFSKNKPQQS